jgi:hypothetical protein
MAAGIARVKKVDNKGIPTVMNKPGCMGVPSGLV